MTQGLLFFVRIWNNGTDGGLNFLYKKGWMKMINYVKNEITRQAESIVRLNNLSNEEVEFYNEFYNNSRWIDILYILDKMPDGVLNMTIPESFYIPEKKKIFKEAFCKARDEYMLDECEEGNTDQN